MIKTNEQVENMQDVQNIITAIIFRQVSEFNRADLFDAVLHYTKGARTRIDKDAVHGMIDATLATAISNDWLVYHSGEYKPGKNNASYSYR